MSRPVAILVGVLLLLTGPGVTRTHGQGTSGLLPRQLTVDGALRIADTLALSSGQRRAWLAAHDEYARVFAGLHEGDVQWLLEHQGLMSLRGEEEGGLTARDFFDRRDRIIRRMAGLDATLFDTLSGYLADAQQAPLRRVRQARARYREVNGAFLWFTPSVTVDLIRDPILPDLDPADAVAIEPVLVEYEAALTRLTRQAHERVVTMYTEIDERRRAMAAAGQEDDPARWQVLANELGQEAFDVAITTRRLQRRTVDRLEAILPPDARRFVRRRFIQRLYPHFAATLPPTFAVFEALLAEGVLDDATGVTVADILDDHDARSRPVITARLDAADRLQAESSPFSTTQADRAAFRKTTEKLATRLAEIDEQTRTRLAEVVAPETLERAVAASEQRVPIVFDTIFQPIHPPGDDASVASTATVFRPIEARVWNERLRPAAPDAATAARLAEHHAGYVTEFTRRVEAWFASQRGGPDETPPDVTTRFARRREAFAALETIETELLAAVPSEAAETLGLRRRLARAALAYENARHDDRRWFTVPCFSTFDVIDRAELPPGVARDLESSMTPPLRELAPRFDELVAATRDELERRERLNAEYRHPSDEDPAARPATRGRLMTDMQNAEAAVLRSVLALVAEQESLLADLRDDVEAGETRTRLDRAAAACLYPTIHGRPDRGLEALAETHVMALTPRQQEDLLALRALHVERTTTLIAKLVDLEQERRRLLRVNPDDRTATASLYLPAQWYAFQRAEVETRTIAWRDLITDAAPSS